MIRPLKSISYYVIYSSILQYTKILDKGSWTKDVNKIYGNA